MIYLGLGIQSNQARLMRDGPFYPDHGLERIVAYHERQDARFAEAAAEISDATGKPILTATELAIADPANAGPATVRASGRLCYASANRAVTALDHLWRRARFLQPTRPARQPDPELLGGVVGASARTTQNSSTHGVPRLDGGLS